MTPAVTIVPANEASWEDLEAVLGSRGYYSRCWCQRWKMRGREWGLGSVPDEERAHRLRAQTTAEAMRALVTTEPRDGTGGVPQNHLEADVGPDARRAQPGP